MTLSGTWAPDEVDGVLGTSSLNGTNRGVAGVSSTSSLYGTIVEGRAGVFDAISLSLPLTLAAEAAAGGGGGGIGSPSPGTGSLKTAIREAAGADVTRCCRSVVPLSFDTLGTFSLMRSFREPSSFHGVVMVSPFTSASSAAEAPEGSTNTCIRAFGFGLEDGPELVELKTSSSGREDVAAAAAALVDVECPDRTDPDVELVSPKTLRRVAVVVDAAGGICSGVREAESGGAASIMRF